MHGTHSLDESKETVQARAGGGLKRRILAVAAAVIVVGVGAVWFTGGFSRSSGAVAQSSQRGGGQGQGRQGVPVEVAKAVRKNVPVRLEALGTVTPIASVAVKARIETEIVKVHFEDGAYVKEGDLLFTLDDRALQAQLNEKLGNAQRNRAALEGAERDVRRYTELIAKGATTQLNLDNASTQANVLRGQVAADESTVENLKVQIGYCTIRAPISGRASMAAVKVGNFVRPADAAPLATIIQTAPVYVSFPVPQKNLPELRKALASETVSVQAVIPGDNRTATGQVAMIENTIDPTTGLVMARAAMPNSDDLLWPGTLVTVQVTLRTEPSVAVPSEAVQLSQNGSFVFVVKDGKVSVKRVTVARTIDGDSVISDGLAGDETVVTAGHLLLSEGAQVSIRQAKAGT
jgi:RND family efflux transporter MFP subunit